MDLLYSKEAEKEFTRILEIKDQNRATEEFKQFLKRVVGDRYKWFEPFAANYISSSELMPYQHQKELIRKTQK
jgi:hypothetical protein